MSDLRSIVFGTAGHVDHGKSALVRALTGTDPDRLAEEKAREMTIDLGFAFLSLPGLDQPVAIVDVPGHGMFVRNMVAGATGIDAAIFVVAADEGVMPQTREHLQVLCRLNVPAGVIVLTKLDKVAPDRLAAAEAEVGQLVAGTFLEAAKIVPVSARTGEGLPALCEELARLAAALPAKQASGPFRLPIDRAFIIKGAGTVVTGTVISGSRRVGDRVDLLPVGRELRIRALQVHNQTVTQIAAGQRAAINLAGVEKEEIRRGEVLAEPGAFAPSQMLDARISLSADAPRPLAQRTRVRLHHGTAEVMARVVLLEDDALAPGQSALAQLRLESPLLAAAGDPFVLRSYSPMHVIGGGVVVDPHPPKRSRTAGAEEVATREQSASDEVVLELLAQAADRGLAEADLQVRSGLAPEELKAALARLKGEGRAVSGRRQVWFSAATVDELAAHLTTALSEHHRSHPIWATAPLNVVLGTVAPRPEQREAARLALESLAAARIVVLSGERVRLSTHQPEWSGRLGAARDSLLRELKKAGLACPALADLSARLRLGEKELRDVMEALVEAGELVPLSADLYVVPVAYHGARARVVEFLREERQMSIGEARELLNLSRKYLLPFLEALDREGTTVRQGEGRRLRRGGDPKGDTSESGRGSDPRGAKG